jgi:hypothetical protein
MSGAAGLPGAANDNAANSNKPEMLKIDVSILKGDPPGFKHRGFELVSEI